MIINNELKQRGMQGGGPGPAAFSTPPAPKSPAPRRRLPRTLLIIALLVMLVSGALALAALVYTAGNQLRVRISNQQSALVDLRQSIPVSPYLLGANVFPATGTLSADLATSGFMSYSARITNGLRSAHIKLLRFPGGDWGESHAYSFDQLNAFGTLLGQVNATGMIQVPLSNVNGQAGDLASRASNAGLIVDYMNNKQSIQRTGKYAHAPFHRIALWTVGNEPDRLINPDTGLIYTVDDYVKAFIQFSTTMHQNDPTIQVFGPEISQFYGVGSGPTDAAGQLWMEGFLKGVSDYERLHPTLRYNLLDGVSFHRYQFDDARQASALLLSSTSEWDYLLPPLRQLIRQDFGQDLPVALTEVNTNPGKAVPSRAFAAVWWADTLGRLMSQQVDYVAFFSTEGVDSPYPLFTTNGLKDTSMLRVMQLFAHLQHNFVPVQAQSEPVSVYATQDDTQQTVSLLFINKSDQAQQAQVSTDSWLPGFLPVSLSGWGPGVQINLSPYSVAVVTLHRNGSAESYSITSPADGLSTPSLVNTICGHQGSTLTSTTAC